MKRRDIINMVTYETGHEDFLIDAVDKYENVDGEQDHVYEAWLYRESMGMKQMIYGMLAERYGTFEEFCKDLEDDDFDEFYGPYDRKVR